VRKEKSGFLFPELSEEPEQIYIYFWGNNSKRETLRGRECRVLVRGRMNSALIEFLDNKQREVVSRNALRKKR